MYPKLLIDFQDKRTGEGISINQIRKQNLAHKSIKMAALHCEIYVQMHILRIQKSKEKHVTCGRLPL